MIARVWAAQTTSGQLPAYLGHLRDRVVPELLAREGYRGVTVLDRALTDGIEIIVITYWHSMDAVRGFAGADVERAVVAAEAAAMLSKFDERVRHYVVAFGDGTASNKVL
ncbi:MAG: antibiotic biosynthesis monooxygenase family protein [Gemmatimonadaceae bacterium]